MQGVFSLEMTESTPWQRPARTRLPAADRRRQIVESATRLIAERGFWGLSIRDVADACGLTVPGVLRHVDSKTGLLIAVLGHREAEDARALAAQLGVTGEELPEGFGHVGGSGVGLRELCAAIVRRNASEPEIVRLFAVLQAEALEPSHPAHDYFVARQERVLARFTELAKGHTPDPEAMAWQSVSLMDGLQIQWLRAPQTTDLVEKWGQAAGVLFAHLDAPAT